MESSNNKRKEMLALQALIIMLAIILIPPLFYAAKLLTSTTAANEIIVSISISVFASVVYLWILDVTNVLSFRSIWVSRSVYGAVIVSILGTSTAVYKGYFVEDKYPFRGAWEVTYRNQVYNASISFSKNSDTYWGYTDVILEKKENETRSLSIEIIDLKPEDNILVIREVVDGEKFEEHFPIAIKRNGKLIEKANKDGQNFRLKRRN